MDRIYDIICAIIMGGCALLVLSATVKVIVSTIVDWKNRDKF